MTALWAIALLWGCAGADDEAQQCKLQSGAVGACCNLQLSEDETILGACVDGLCTDGVTRQPNPLCGDAPPLMRDRGIRDAAPPEDAAAGGAGGQGGAGGGEADQGLPPDQGMGGQGGMGGAPDPCANVTCDPGQRCDPMTGACLVRPAAACEDAGQCPDGDCLTEDASMGTVPGGFCRVACRDDEICNGGICLPSGDGNICFDRCDDGSRCREGWTCVDVEQPQSAICLPDCRVAGCANRQVCNDDTGQCDPAPPACRYPCQAGETCTDGRCIRQNRTCETDYHCEEGVRQCRNGQCIVSEFTDCLNAAACDGSQTCVPTGNDTGLCLFSCQNDDQCPADRSCYPDLRACYYILCGPSRNNGQINGACQAGSGGQWPGTCLPVNAPPPGEAQIGICLEAGNVGEGGVCDAQADGRAAADRALQCGQGMICFDDPDDPLDPARDWGNRGECVRLCDPRNGVCNGQRRCVDFGSRDDPATPDSELRYLGFCLETDCSIRADDCGAGNHCRPYSFVADQGRCGPAGDVALGQPCENVEQCGDHAICANAGDGLTCFGICDPAEGAAACPGGQRCVTNTGWAYGVCL
ncbi:MAG: hypothetical protein H6706_13870 [Myxococcales bacterium]|nr:hypothetical protein [Myxococcales bacterium]